MTAILAVTCILCPAIRRTQLISARAAVEIPGIDVSKYQEEIDWQAVADSDAKFAIIRCCKVIREYDDWEVDPRLEENYANAKAAGVPIGCYIYTDAATEEEFVSDVNYMMGFLKGKSFEFPVFLDVESAKRQEHLPSDTFMPAILAGLESIEDAGHTAGVYSSSAFYKECLNRSVLQEAGYAIWVANYFTSSTGLASPAGYDLSSEATIWQYSGCGKCDGIRTTVDRNICYTYSYFEHNAVITNSALPVGTLKSGSHFTVSGTISSDHVLRTITGSIYDVSKPDEPIQTIHIYPHAREYKLTGFFTKRLPFENLPDGDYEFRITATDSSDAEITVVESSFSVAENGSEPPVIQDDENESTSESDNQRMEETEETSSAAALSRKQKDVGNMQYSVWFYDHCIHRRLCAGATALGDKLDLRRTPLYRIVSSACYRIEACYLVASLRIRIADNEKNHPEEAALPS
ncbi:MAG: hypothetical protein MJ071_05650 [Oscillospiraceae bacterium]|nr:hypothetical protein [Oscillospiraceae bacterium]